MDLDLKILLSFHYYKNSDLASLIPKLNPAKVFIDSGAFSAKTQGVSVDIDQYVKFIYTHNRLIDYYACLDVIGDHKKTMQNQREMEKQGLSPLPVAHYGISKANLHRVIDQYPHFCLGGLVGRGKKDSIPFVNYTFKSVPPDVKVHGFGVTSWEIIKTFPFYSVDSSSWAAVARYGNMKLFDPDIGRWHGIKLRDRDGVYRFARLIRRYGFSPNDLCVESRYHHVVCRALSILCWRVAEIWLARQFGLRRRMYLAEGEYNHYVNPQRYLQENQISGAPICRQFMS